MTPRGQAFHFTFYWKGNSVMPAPIMLLDWFGSLWEEETPDVQHSSQPGRCFLVLGDPPAPTCSEPSMRDLITRCVSVIKHCLKRSESTLRYGAPGIRKDCELLRLRRCRGFSLCLFKYPCALFQILKKKKRKNALMSIIFTQNKFKTLQSRQWYYSNIPWIHYIKHEILSLSNVCFSFQCF